MGVVGEIARREACLSDVQSMIHCDGAYQGDLIEYRARDYKIAIKSENIHVMVVEAGGLFAGYMMFEHVGGSIEIVRIAVDQMLLRCGIGGHMVGFLQDQLTMPTRHGWTGVRSVWAEVRDDNLRAQKFFKSLGFYASVPLIRRNYGNFYKFTSSLLRERVC